MSWRDQLRAGSFRGAQFLIKSADTGVGRRINLVQYPLRDLPWGEDLGRRARRFRVECIVLGPDYMAARDALIAALEAEGAGTLVHPYLGTRQVVVAEEATIAESTREGGMARFSIPFAEAGAKTEPAATSDTAGALAGAGADAQTVLANSFANAFNVAELPGWVTDAALADQASLLDQLRAIATSITTLPAPLLDFLNMLAEYSSALTQLILAPARLAKELGALIASLGPIAVQPINALNVYGNLLGWVPGTADTSDSPAAATPSRIQQQANRTALVHLVQGSALASGCATIATVPAQSTAKTTGFDSRDAALAARATFAGAIAAQQEDAGAENFAVLADLRTALVKDIAVRAATLPRLITFTPPGTLPAMLIANRLYDDPTRDAEIVARNDLRYPGFVAGAAALEVLDA
ncbi:MAG: DNA circularization protein [Bradyrhizobium sp.]